MIRHGVTCNTLMVKDVKANPYTQTHEICSYCNIWDGLGANLSQRMKLQNGTSRWRYILVVSSVLVSSYSLKAKVMSAHLDIQSDLMCRTIFSPSALLILFTFISHDNLTRMLQRPGLAENIMTNKYELTGKFYFYSVYYITSSIIIIIIIIF